MIKALDMKSLYEKLLDKLHQVYYTECSKEEGALCFYC